MSRVDALIASFTERQYGLIARWQALGRGISASHFDRRVASGDLIVIYAGVYRLRGVPYTQEMRWLAAVLAGGPTARLSHLAGSSFHGFEVTKPRPQITVAYGNVRSIPGVDVFRSRRAVDVVVVRGVRVTSKARTVLDSAVVLPFPAYELFVQNTVNAKLVTIESLLAILDRRGGKGVEGTVALRHALSGGFVDEKIVKKLELLIARIVDRAAVPRPDRQLQLTCADGRRVVLDNAWRDRKVAVEGDGQRWHGNAAQARATRARARSITATGWGLYQYGWSDATETPRGTQREIESLFCDGSTAIRRVDPSQNEEGDEKGAA